MSPTDAEIELLPCPWCGEKPTVIWDHSGSQEAVAIECENVDGCKVLPRFTVDIYEEGQATKAEAIGAWNTRASPTREQSGWLPIETCPIGEKVEVIWFEDGDFEGPEAISMRESRNEFWNLNSGNLNRRIPDQPHTWPSHWRYISREGLPPPPTALNPSEGEKP